jgi:HK97 family phage prohead protease
MIKTLNNIEVRRMSAAPEFRVESVTSENGDTKRYVSGYAVVFEQYSRPFWDEWVEIIDRNAFANTDMSDVVMVVDHSREVGDVLARSKNGVGSLEISVDDTGVKFRFEVPNTTRGRDLVELIERGDISECSFAFWTKADEWRYDVAFGDKTMDVRRVLEVSRLADLSIVVTGQYGQTSVDIDERALIEESRRANRPKTDRKANSLELAKLKCRI